MVTRAGGEAVNTGDASLAHLPLLLHDLAPGLWPRGWGPLFQMVLKARKIADVLMCVSVCVCAHVQIDPPLHLLPFISGYQNSSECLNELV